MKKLFTIFVFFFFVSLLTFDVPSIKADWVPVNNGLTELHINALTATGNYIFVGNDQYVYRSTNNGDNWQQVYDLSALALASNGSYIYRGYENGYNYSTNYGANWIFADLNLWVTSILSNGNYVYAGCFYPLHNGNNGVWISTNYGANWTQTSLNNKDIYALAINGNFMFAGADVYGVFSSTDNGLNWSQTSLNFTTVLSLAINGNYIFAGGNGSGIYISSNNGINWIQSSLNNATPTAMLIYGNIVIEGGGGPSSIYISSNNGGTWVPRMEGMPYWVNTLCISNGYIFAGTDGMGVFRRPLNEIVGVKSISAIIPKEFILGQNYPNPFNPETKIDFSIKTKSFIQIIIYDALGRKVDFLVNEELEAGTYLVSWNVSGLSTGIYFYRLIADNKIVGTKKMIINK